MLKKGLRMSKNVIVKQTSLEATDNVKAVLDWKLEQLQENNAPVETGMADYIALAATSFDERIKELRNYKKLIDEEIKAILEKKTATMEEIADWLQNDMGVNKLKGVKVSSISIKEKSVSISKKFVWDIGKEEAIEKGLAHYEETIKEIPHGIRVNKKRAKDEGNT